MADEPTEAVGTPYFGALETPILMMGCERAPFALLAGIALAPGYLGFHAFTQGAFVHGLVGVAAGAALFLAGVNRLQALAKRDPIYIRTFVRNRRYRRFYPARSTPWCAR